MMRNMPRFCVLFLCAFLCRGESPGRSYVSSHQQQILREFIEVLSIPNIASDPTGILKNAEAIRRTMDIRGIRTRYLETDGAPPVVFGELLTPGAQRTLIFYAHYDGQPVDT